MIFTEYRFLAFFAVVFLVHWGLRGERSRKGWLLLASYGFYAAWDWRFLSLIWVSTAVDYWVGLRLAKEVDGTLRRRLLGFSLAVNLGLLGVFKYFNFFAESLAALLDGLGIPWHPATLSIILPVGISFYTFQTLSYSIDIYRHRLQPTRDLLDLALFVAFFPQLVAGPIVRAREFLPQLDTARRFARVAVRPALVLFLVGFFKKACVSDNLAPFVDRYFANPELFTAASAWLAVLGYAIQIYCDFSGYTDMAIACARLLGYELTVNFNFPYFATDVRDFWRRWHISLSTWLRDYLYIPLGGNRGGPVRTQVNLMMTMLLGGLWHGAAWTFVIWGALHGLALAVHRGWERFAFPLPRVVAGLLTFYWVCVAWIFFRAQGLGEALDISRAFILWTDHGERVLEPRLVWIYAVLLVLHAAAALAVSEKSPLRAPFERLPDTTFAVLYGAAAALVVALAPRHAEAFIYFQF